MKGEMGINGIHNTYGYKEWAFTRALWEMAMHVGLNLGTWRVCMDAWRMDMETNGCERHELKMVTKWVWGYVMSRLVRETGIGGGYDDGF